MTGRGATPVEPGAADRAMGRCADGDGAAFALVYEALERRLFAYLLRLAPGPAAAEDALQQTFMQMLAARATFARGAAVLPWAYAIARRVALDARRRSAREPLASGEPPGVEQATPEPGADDALARRQQEATAWRELAYLPEAWREAFALVKLEGLSVAEASEVLGITPGNVKVRIHRARVALAGSLEGSPGPAA